MEVSLRVRPGLLAAGVGVGVILFAGAVKFVYAARAAQQEVARLKEKAKDTDTDTGTDKDKAKGKDEEEEEVVVEKTTTTVESNATVKTTALSPEEEAEQKVRMEAEGWVRDEPVWRGWVEQGGSVCAAAAVAGAWNAAHSQSLVLHLGKPAHGLALCMRDGLDLYETILGPKSAAKLYHNKSKTKEKMSTWCIGNDKVIRALKAAHTKVRNGNTDLRTTARTYITTKHVDRAWESPEKNDAAWEMIKKGIHTPRVVLLFHTKNHYCLISGYYEGTHPETGEVVRKIMFAPKGQRPDRVISFRDVVEIIARFKNYKIIRVEAYSTTNPDMELSEDAYPPKSASAKESAPVVWLGGGPNDEPAT